MEQSQKLASKVLVPRYNEDELSESRLGKTAAFSLNKCRHYKHIEVEVEVVVENQLGCIVLPLLSGRSRRMLMATVDLPCMNMTGNMTVILLASHQTLSGNGIHWYEPIISPDISHQN